MLETTPAFLPRATAPPCSYPVPLSASPSVTLLRGSKSNIGFEAGPSRDLRWGLGLAAPLVAWGPSGSSLGIFLPMGRAVLWLLVEEESTHKWL